MSPPPLTSELTTCIPPWCPRTGPDPLDIPPEHFVPTMPHVLRRTTSLWDVLGDVSQLNDETLQERIVPICREIYEYQVLDIQRVYGLSRSLLAKYGEVSMRVIRRVWDLHLAYNTKTKVPGLDPGVFGQSVWLTTLRDVYADDFKAATWKVEDRGGPFIADVLIYEHIDRLERAEKEREVFEAMDEELSQDRLDNMPADKISALNVAALPALRQCLRTAETFHEIMPSEDESGLDQEDEEDLRVYQALQLWHVSARAAMEWEPRRPGTLSSILETFCDDMLRRRKKAVLERDEELHHQLERILGDTRNGQFGFHRIARRSTHGDGLRRTSFLEAGRPPPRVKHETLPPQGDPTGFYTTRWTQGAQVSWKQAERPYE
ncbi:hypothetical protein ACJZ2D_003305 [Fusarium nematophilum]